MGTMYKEIICRKKLPAMLLIFCVMLIFILLSDFINNSISGINVICNMFFLALTIICCIVEVYKCGIRYKYSIIADQLIIHKLVGKAQVLVEDIRIVDIHNIGISDKQNKSIKIFNTRKYICSVLGLTNKYCCVYKNNGKYYRFYFEPSKEMVERINSIRQKKEEFNSEISNKFVDKLIKVN